jgi:anti-sigma regulatory factor (Ser/Thr protein kinase)
VADSLAPRLPVTGGFRHIGFFYRSHVEYAQGVAGFLRAGLAAGEPAFTAVPAAKVGLIRDALGADASHVEFADMAELGRNPAWIIPRVLTFTNRHPGQRVRYVGEPVWPSRTDAELREATRHEALINLAFAANDVDILCPYDNAGLDSAVVADAMRTHPLLLSALSGGGYDGHGGYEESPGFAVPSLIPPSCGLPLPAPPPDAVSHRYRTNLSEVRMLVFMRARGAGLTEARANDLVLAVSEVAANTLRHTPSHGTLDIWHDQREIICEVRDEGTITDPLAGRRLPDRAAHGGHGLWLVYQVCDLVELRSDRTGTTVRMHMAIHPSAAGH